jgi:SAM-dependent methyltransferase
MEALWLIIKFRFFDTRHLLSAGHVTLENLAGAPNISRWMLEQFDDYLGDAVLEAGCGAGNLTRSLISRKHLTALDIDPTHVAEVLSRYGHLRNVDVVAGDLDDPTTFDRWDSRFDSVLCVNVMEHLARPDQAASGFARVLRPGGHALVLVPGHRWLFSAADEALGHHMRYSSSELREVLEGAGLEIIEMRQFNRLGVLGWMVNKALGRTDIGRLQAKAFGWLLPLARLLEKVEALPGLSWVAIARRT